MKKTINGFTIVELLIVIVVIAILAAITIAAFNGVQSRARTSIMSSGLAQAVRQLKLYAVDNGDNYPTDLIAAGVGGDDTTYQYKVNNSANPKTYCITASNGGSTMYASNTSLPVSGACSGHYVNLVKPFSSWTTSGGVSYDSAKGEMSTSNTTGNAVSPLVDVSNSSSTRITLNAYATQPSPSGNPNSSVYYNTNYYGSDGVTPATNSNGYTGNGDAACVIPLSTWVSCSRTMVMGPNVKYIRYTISSSPAQYTSDNRYKNVQISAAP